MCASIPSLSAMALAALPTMTWHSLDVHTQRCLFPSDLARAVSGLQRRLLLRSRIRTAAMLCLLSGQARDSPKPVRTVVHPLCEFRSANLRRGDHVVVLRGWGWFRYAHHGVVHSEPSGDTPVRIVDFSSPTGDPLLRDAALRVSDLARFAKGCHSSFGIVEYAPSRPEHHARASRIAALLVRTPVLHLRRFPFSENCESLAVACHTGHLGHFDRTVADSSHDRRFMRSVFDEMCEGEESSLTWMLRTVISWLVHTLFIRRWH